MTNNKNPIHSNPYPRLKSLDVFRGITIALMILVNSPGNYTPYPWLEHAEWDGCQLADLVFPFFIFIVGVASVYSLSKSVTKGLNTRALMPKIIERTLLIFLIGLLLNAFPNHFDFETIRTMGVLQRIAITYFFSAFLFLTTSLRTQIITTVVLLIGYWLLIVAGSPPHYDEANNLAAIIDRLLLAPQHLYKPSFEPEGLLSTLPAIATALMGNITAIWLLSPNKTSQQKFQGLIGSGFIALCLGELWGFWFPINKTLWTSSYVLWTGGIALWVLALCYGSIEIKGWKKWSTCFEIFGVNALAVYVLHIFFLKVQVMITITGANNSSQNLKLYLTDTLFSWTSSQNAALLYALAYTLLWFAVLAILYRHKIYIGLNSFRRRMPSGDAASSR